MTDSACRRSMIAMVVVCAVVDWSEVRETHRPTFHALAARHGHERSGSILHCFRSPGVYHIPKPHFLHSASRETDKKMAQTRSNMARYKENILHKKSLRSRIAARDDAFGTRWFGGRRGGWSCAGLLWRAADQCRPASQQQESTSIVGAVAGGFGQHLRPKRLRKGGAVDTSAGRSGLIGGDGPPTYALRSN